MPVGLLERIVSGRVTTQSGTVRRPLSVTQPGLGGRSLAGGGFQAMAQGMYGRNVTVNAGLNLLATSASEPQFCGIRNRVGRADLSRARAALRENKGQNRAGSMALTQILVKNAYIEQVPQHPLVQLLNNPNPYRTGDAFWMMAVLDYYLDGNCYIVKARTPLGNVGELWRLRPDRVKIIPSATEMGVIDGYSLAIGSNKTVIYPAEDIIHWRAPNPLDDYAGLSPLLAAIDAVDIDNDMKIFLKSFFRNGGSGPGSILTVKTGLSAEEKAEIQDRKRRAFGGPAGAHEMLILDNAESSYQQLGLDRGLRDALPKEIAAMVAAEISMNLGIPASILGQLIGLESSSYANKRADWQVLWDVKLTPLMSSLDGALNLSFFPKSGAEFAGIDEVYTDLSNIRALQEDEDALQERARKNVAAGLWSFEEGRLATGKDPSPQDGTFFIPSNLVPTPVERIGEEPAPPATSTPAAPPMPGEPAEPPMPMEPANLGVQMVAAMRAIAAPRVGRPALLNDPGAQALYQRAVALRQANPTWAWTDVAAEVGISERQLRRYRGQFS